MIFAELIFIVLTVFIVFLALIWQYFGIIVTVTVLLISISAFAYYIYFVKSRGHVKLSKILPEWVVFRKICSYLDEGNDSLCLKLLESYEKNIAWEYAKYHFEVYEQEHVNLLKELELLKRSKEKDKNDRIKIIKGIFSDHYNDFSKTFEEKMEEASILKHQDLTQHIKSSLNKHNK